MKSVTALWKERVAGAVSGQVSLREFLWGVAALAVCLRLALLGGWFVALAILVSASVLGGWFGFRRRSDPVEGIIGALGCPLALTLGLFVFLMLLAALVSAINAMIVVR